MEICPIYIERCYIDSFNYRKLQESTDRPVILINGCPKDHVLDVQEELRDKFAMAALEGYSTKTYFGDRGQMPTAKQIAERCYELADAMLVERLKK